MRKLTGSGCAAAQQRVPYPPTDEFPWGAAVRISAHRAALVVSALVIALLAGCAGQSTPSTGEHARYGSITLPAIWQPNYDYQATEIANNLKGVTPQNPYLSITPEDWYYVGGSQ